MLSRARAALLVLLLALLTVGPVAGYAVAQPTVDHSAESAVSLQSAQSDSTGETTFRIQLQPDGDARWTVLLNYSIETTARRDAFDDLAAEFETGDSRTLAAVRAASRQASRGTNRQMTISGVEKTSRTRNGTGQLVLQFTWTNFSRQSNASLHVGDVFNSTSGTWFRELAADQSLVIVPPQGYSLVDAEPPGYGVSNGSLRWEGERTFAPGQISVTYERDQTSQPQFPLFVVGLVVVGFGAVVAVAYLFSTRDVALPAVLGGTTATDDQPSGDGGTTAPPPSELDAPVDDDTEPSPDTGTEAEADADADADDEIDEELLSDEERIERLLDANGGRMKQANIVKETGWSNAKVSQLLSAMDEDDRIDKLRIGRENLISFPDEDITDTGNGN